MQRGDILGLQEMEPDEIRTILDQAHAFKEILSRRIKKVPTLRGQSICTLFYEPSTRTRASFELAAKIMSADAINVASSSSSVVKGESLKDTVLTLEAMGIDLLVIRHSMAGAPAFAAQVARIPVINAGDGLHEHPTQGLLDLFTMRDVKGRLEGLKVAIVGDIAHSRVARSAIHLLSKLGSKITLCGPPELLPEITTTLAPGLRITRSCEDAVRGADVVMVLRVQKERLAGLQVSLADYVTRYQMTMARLRLAKNDAMFMHPGPIIRGLELTWEVADCPQSVIVEEVKNGVPLRMAVLARALGKAS